VVGLAVGPELEDTHDLVEVGVAELHLGYMPDTGGDVDEEHGERLGPIGGDDVHNGELVVAEGQKGWVVVEAGGEPWGVEAEVVLDVDPV
jgi:hypothetical protein